MVDGPVMPLRIGIDLTARLPVATGVDTYLENLVTALAKEDRENLYTLWVNLEDRDFFNGRPPANFKVIACCLRPRPPYYRLRGAGAHAHAHTDEELQTLHGLCREPLTYCLFNNASMKDDARRFRALAADAATRHPGP